MAGINDLLANRALNRVPDPAPTVEEAQFPTTPETEEQIRLSTSGETGLGLRAGVEQTSAMLKGALAAAADAVGTPKFGQSMRRSAGENLQKSAEIMSYSDAPQSLADVSNANDFAKYALSGVARNAPQLGVMAAGAALGRGAGVFGAAAGMNVGDVYLDGNAEIDQLKAAGQIDDAREQALRERVLTHSGIAGLAMGALDMAGFGAIAPKMVGAMARNGALKQIMHAVRTEGATEAVQEYIGMAAKKLALEKPDVLGLSQEEVWQLADAGVLGGLTGGVFATPGAVASKVQLPERPQRPGAEAPVPSAPTPTPPSGPPQQSFGRRAGLFSRSLLTGDTRAVRSYMDEMWQDLQSQPVISEGADQVNDFFEALRTTPRDELWWSKHEDRLREGWNQISEGVENATDGMYERYKKLATAMMPTNISMPEMSAEDMGKRVGRTVGAFNTWLKENKPVFDEMVSKAEPLVQGAKDAAANFSDRVSTAMQEAGQTAEEIRDYFARKWGEVREDMTRDEAQAAADRFSEGVRDNGPAGEKFSLVKNKAALDDTGKIIKSALVRLRPAFQAHRSQLNQVAIALQKLMSDRRRLDYWFSRDDVAGDIVRNFNMPPEEFIAYMYASLQSEGRETNNDALGYMGQPAADALYGEPGTQDVVGSPMLAEELDAEAAAEGVSAPAENWTDAVPFGGNEDANTGVTEQTITEAEQSNRPAEQLNNMAIIPGQAERATFNRMRAPKTGGRGAKRRVFETRVTRDPNTGEVIKEEKVEHNLNLMDMSKAMIGGRAAKQDTPGWKRNDENFMDAVGFLAGGWTEEDAAGNPVEVSFAPPSGTMENWFGATKGNEAPAIGRFRKRDRTFEDLEKANRARPEEPLESDAPKRYLRALNKYAESVASLAPEVPRQAYDNALAKATSGFVFQMARNAAANRQPVDLRMSEVPEQEQIANELSNIADAVREGLDPVASVDNMWALLYSDGTPTQVKSALVDAVGFASVQDDVTAMIRGNPAQPEQLKEVRRKLQSAPPEERNTPEYVQTASNYAENIMSLVGQELKAANEGGMPAALLLLPSEVLANHKDAIANNLEASAEGLRRMKETPTLEDKAAQLETTPETGVATQDASGQYIDYRRVEEAGMPYVQEKGLPLSAKSVVTLQREKARNKKNKPRNPADWLANPELVRGITIQQEVQIAETGETATIEEDAADVLVALKQREDVLQRLRGCVK